MLDTPELPGFISTMKRPLVFSFLIAGALVIALLSTRERGGADVSVMIGAGQPPWRVTVKVVRSDGAALRDAHVLAWNSSGGSSARTDSAGLATMQVGEGVIQAVYIEHVLVKKWSWKPLAVSDGALINVELPPSFFAQHRQ